MSGSITEKDLKRHKLPSLFTGFAFVLLAIIVADAVIVILTRFDLRELLSRQNVDPSSLVDFQFFGFIIKTSLVMAGVAILILIARQNTTIVRQLQKSIKRQKEKEEHNHTKSAELSDMMRRLGDKNRDLEKYQDQLDNALSIIAQKERDLRIIFEKSPLGMIRVDETGVIREFNDRSFEILGSQRDRLQDYPTLDNTVPELQKTIKQAINGEKAIFEDTYTSITGTRTLYMRVIANPVNPDNPPTEIICSVEDITYRKEIEDQLLQSRDNLENLVNQRTTALLREIEERKHAQEELRKSEERYRLITENSSDVIWTLDFSGKFTYVSPSVKQLTGHTQEEMLALPMDQTLVPESVQKVMNTLERELSRPEAERKTHDSLEVQQYTKNREIIDIEVSVSWILDDDNQPIGIQGISRDISERKRTEQALLKSEEKHRTILESIDDAYFESDLDANLTFINRAMEEMTGYSEAELLGIPFRKYNDEKSYDIVHNTFSEVIKTGRKRGQIYCSIVTKQNKVKHIGMVATPKRGKDDTIIGIQGVARDITDQRNLEQKLRQTQKMEAIGNLAGGVAHDFNNILGGILGYAQLIKSHPDSKTRVLSFVDHIIKASSRATGLINQILLFSRKGESRKIPTDLGLITEEVLKLLRASIPATIKIKHHFESNLNPVLADQTQIHQVLMNLSNNAAHAMRENGGTLELKLENYWINESEIFKSPGMSLGSHVKLSLIDTGHGMDTATLERIFDPYFTTKKQGEGTGLGLSSVHGIVEDHGGHIQVESQPGVGTTFFVCLPAIEQNIESAELEDDAPMGSESILFVDDEEYLSSIGKEMLEDYGYSVEALTNPVEALKLFEENPDRFDLLITDFTMPEMTGDKLVDRILELKSQFPVIMCTGIVLPPEIQQKPGISRIVMKPLDMYALLKVIRKTLDSK